MLHDYDIVAAGLAALLEPYRDRVVLTEAISQGRLGVGVDVLLYDPFGRARGEQLKLRALTAATSARIVVFTWRAQPRVVAACLRHGAAGYLLKDAAPGQIVETIERIHGGEIVTPSLGQVSHVEPHPVAAAVAAGVRGDWLPPDVCLTARESQVLELLTRGLTTQEIADQCYLSVNSVKTHLRGVYRKIGVHRRSQAVVWGMTHGFGPDPDTVSED